MQQWSPDELIDEIVAASAEDVFAPADDQVIQTLDFVEDYPSDSLTSFLKRLEKDERDALYQLVDTQIRDDVTRELAQENEHCREQAHLFIEELAERLEEKIDEELAAVARNAVELSIAMSEQIMRRAIELDRGAILKAIETIILRAKHDSKFTIIAHPEDAQFLEQLPDELSSLNIVAVESDQRMERGGCTITADGHEWDCTVGGRFEELSEIVRENILPPVETQEEPA